MRALVAIVLGLCCIATSCLDSVGIAVAPRPGISADSAERVAFGSAAATAARLRLAPVDPPDQEEEGWEECYSEATLFLCGKVIDRELQFRIVQTGVRRFTPRADSLKRELLNGLRAEFGDGQVRECDWRGHRDRRRSGCAPLTQTDSR